MRIPGIGSRYLHPLSCYSKQIIFIQKQSVPVNVFYKDGWDVIQWERTYPELKKSELGGEHRADVLVAPRLTVLHLVG